MKLAGDAVISPHPTRSRLRPGMGLGVGSCSLRHGSIGTGAHAACIEFIIDITEAKDAEERSSSPTGARTSSSRPSLMSCAIRSPLRNGLQIIRRAQSTGQDIPLERVAAMMERQLSHLVHLVDDLLDVGRITCGKIQLKIHEVLLDDVLAHSVETCRAMIDEQGHELIVESETGGLRVRGDFDRLTRCLPIPVERRQVYGARWVPPHSLAPRRWHGCG